MSETNEVKLWDRMHGEPQRWYTIFVNYYLPQGPGRSVRRAHTLYSKDHPEIEPSEYTPVTWFKMAEKWQWKERVDAFETEQNDLARATIDYAAKLLRLLTVDAVQALQIMLKSDRYAVSAAKEILDRGGIPATSIQELAAKVDITSDDMAEAREQVEKWERENTSKSG
jgi:hypothetical protein